MALVQIQDVQGGKAVEGDDRESKRPRSDGTESARDGRSPGKKELNWGNYASDIGESRIHV